MSNRSFRLRYGAFLCGGSILILAACAGLADRETAENTAQTSAADQSATDPVPCSVWSNAVVANSGALTLNAHTLVDSYDSASGAYGGGNTGAGAIVQAAKTITNNGAAVRGLLRPNTPGGFSVIPVPTNAKKLPLGSTTPGSLNINTAADSITLAPGNYVAANINVNFPGAIKIAPAGQVRIWVTGNLNLGGNENLNGVPRNLAFLVTSSSFVNVNSGGSLYGAIYAPTASVALNSPIFGSLVGGNVNFLNTGAAVHFDRGAACSQTATTPGGTGLDPLPKPPGQPGCYIGTLNGWLGVNCENPKTILGSGFTSMDVSTAGLATTPPVAGAVIPLVYGQVESTLLAGTENNEGETNNNIWGAQLNTNTFPCPSPNTGQCWFQFGTPTDGNTGHTAVCIETWKGGPSWTDSDFCVGADGTPLTTTGGTVLDVTTRQGGLQAGDFVNLGAYAYTSGGSALVAAVAQFSWVSTQDVQPSTETTLPNRIPGLYAVVAPDQYALANSWTNVTGGLMGGYSGFEAVFENAEVVQRFAISNCQDDVSASGPTCPTKTALTAGDVQYQTDATSAETNNLQLVPSPIVTFPNQNLAVTEQVSSTSGTGGKGTCLASLSNHIYMKDNEGDNGGIPSSVGGVPFWESPDIFVVPLGAPAPGVNDTPADVALTGGTDYNVYLRVRNDFGCTAVPGPISVYIDAADPNLGFANWQGVTTNAAAGAYDSYGSAGTTIVGAFASNIIGPFPWKPAAGGHKCLLAAISGPNETPPTVSASAPVLPPAYNSNQIAQRNVQIDSDCSYQITNTSASSANLLLGISMTPASPAPGAAGGPSVSLVIGDVGGVWKALWSATAGLSSVTNDGTKTTIVLSSSYIGLPSVPLAAGQSPSVDIVIVPPSSGTLPKVNVSAMLTEPETGTILQQNGGSCTATAQVIGE